MNAQTNSTESGSLATEIARIFPPQGHWETEDYLRVTEHSRCLVELVDGTVEVLEMPTESHQLIVQFLFLAFHSFIAPRRLGTLVFAPIRMRTVGNRFREPDLAFLATKHADKRGNDFWRGADLVVEVVSDDRASRVRDLETKRAEYARSGIEEYWIVDPSAKSVSVLTLNQGQYVEWGVFLAGETATSTLLPGFAVGVDEVWRAAE